MDEKFSISFKNNPWEIYRVVEFLKFTIAVKISFTLIDWLIFMLNESREGYDIGELTRWTKVLRTELWRCVLDLAIIEP